MRDSLYLYARRKNNRPTRVFTEWIVRGNNFFFINDNKFENSRQQGCEGFRRVLTNVTSHESQNFEGASPYIRITQSRGFNNNSWRHE